MATKYRDIALGAMLSLVMAPAGAGPAEDVQLPTVEYGVWEIDFRYGSASDGDGKKERAAVIGFGYGVTDFWFTQIDLQYEKSFTEGTHFQAIEWENKFQLPETGDWPMVVGLLTELEIPRRSGEAYEFRFGPLLQGELGRFQVNGNLLFEFKFRGDERDEPHETEIGYQLQAKYRWERALEVGIQGFGEMGKWNDWRPRSEQSHRFGPSVHGEIFIGARQAIKCNAALLFGLTDAAPDHTFRLQIEYEL